MNYRNFILVILCILASACSDNEKSTPSDNDNAVENTGHVLYTANSGLDSIGVFAVEPTTGDLFYVNSVSAGPGSAPRALVATPNNKFLYTANHGSDSVSGFSIHQTSGQLTLLGQKTGYLKPYAISVNPAGTFLFVSYEGSNATVVYSISSANGALTEVDNYNYGGATVPTSFAIHPTNVFAVATTDDFLHPYSINGSGVIAPVSVNEIIDGEDVQFSPNGLMIAVADNSAGQVITYSVDVNNGTPLSNQRIKNTTSASPSQAVLWDRTSSYLYVASPDDQNLEAFSVASGTGILTGIGVYYVDSNCQNRSLARDPGGKYIFTACSSALGVIKSYGIQTNGTLTDAGYNQLSNAKVLGLESVKLY